MNNKLIAVMTGLLLSFSAIADTQEAKPNDPYFDQFHPLKAPPVLKHYLKPGDRLAICGDSITEQRKYSRIMETYLMVCVPELQVSVRQYGWGGEKTPGFLARMTNDCLRFKPTIATTAYGMNDHLYRGYTDQIGAVYRSNSIAIDESFKAHGARVVEGSPGCVGKRPSWGNTNSTTELLNQNLCTLRNIGIEISKKEKIGFADVFWPMLVAGHEAQEKYGTNYGIAGKDGVHPGWAGHLVMAYAFLRSLGLDGDIGTFTVDLRSNKAKVTSGHEFIGYKDGGFEIKSHRYPFCIGEGEPSSDDSIRSGTLLVPFNRDLNRLTLVVKHAKAKAYRVTWGDQTKTFDAEHLAKGINLPVEFLVNPFTEAFNKVDAAVAAKQEFETTEIKKTFRSEAAKTDMEGTATKAENERTPLVDAVHAAFVPVVHSIKIVPVS